MTQHAILPYIVKPLEDIGNETSPSKIYLITSKK